MPRNHLAVAGARGRGHSFEQLCPERRRQRHHADVHVHIERRCRDVDLKSKKTKLLRGTSSTVVSYSGGKLTVSGAVTLPLVKGGGATIKARTGCTGTWKPIGTTKFKTNSFVVPVVVK